MALYLADGSENDYVNVKTSDLLAEMEALRQRLAALEAQLPGNAAKELAGRQSMPHASGKMVVWLTGSAVLAMLAGASVVYGQSAVDAFLISKEGDVAIGPSGALFVGKDGNIAVGPSRFVSSGYKLLVSTGEPKTQTSTSEAAGFAVTTSEADNPFGLGIRLKGGPALADRSAVLVTTDVNLGEGGHLVLQPSRGNVGIGTAMPNADNKLEVNGTIAANSLNIVGSTSMKTMSTPDQSVKIEGAGGRNMFSDEEKAGNLRVGAAWGTPGIYSEKGDVVLGSQSNNVWLYGKVAISTQGDAGKRNQPETLYVDGGIKATGTVDGSMKVVYQRDDEAQTTYQKPLWRYHMSLTAGKYGGRTKTVPNDTLTALCGKQDGCEVRLGMTRWDDPNKTETASMVKHFYYSPADKHWRISWPDENTWGVIGNGATVHAMNLYNTCFFTDGTYENYQSKGDKGTGMQLLVFNGNNNPARTCELTIIP